MSGTTKINERPSANIRYQTYSEKEVRVRQIALSLSAIWNIIKKVSVKPLIFEKDLNKIKEEIKDESKK